MTTLKKLIPTSTKLRYWRWLEDRRLMREFGVSNVKYARELDYWRSRWESSAGRFENEFYERIFLAMAGEADAAFCADRIVADFGCGPRGSLNWLTTSRVNIGIDVLANGYSRFGIARHNMCYVCATERTIPLPSNYVDVLFTLNAIDHVDNFETICEECLRILAAGGTLVGSFNMYERPTACEPQCLTEDMIERHLLRFLKVQTYRLVPQGPKDDRYRYCFSGQPVKGVQSAPSDMSALKILWVRADKTA